jgi:hypothetical protein
MLVVYGLWGFWDLVTHQSWWAEKGYPLPFEIVYLKIHIAADLFTFLITLGVGILLVLLCRENRE